MFLQWRNKKEYKIKFFKKYFAVHSHGKHIVFVVRLVLVHGKDNAQANGCE
jgi:hypothetical protein